MRTSCLQQRIYIVTLLFLVCVTKGAFAQVLVLKDTKVALSSEDARTFDAAFRSLSRQANVAFVIEGRPLHSKLSEKEAAPLQRSAQLSSLLALLCKQYDYEVVLDKNNKPPFADVLALKKKYTQVAEVPGVTMGECLASAQEIERLLAQFGGMQVSDRKAIVNNAFRSFPPAQRQKLQTGIPISALSAQQKNYFLRVATYAYLGAGAQSLRAGRSILESANSFVVTSKGKGNDQSVIVLARDQYGDQSGPLRGFVPGLHGFTSRAEVMSRMKTANDTVTPTTLADALDAASVKADAEPFLRTKSVTFFNPKAASGSHFVRAAALVYGLKAIQPSASAGWSISRNHSQSPVSLSTVFVNIREDLPQPLVRATAARRNEGRPSFSDFRADRSRASDLAEVSILRIEALYKARSKGKAGFRATLKELGPEAQEAFAAFVMAAYLSSVSENMRRTPVYISDFNSLYATVREEGNMVAAGLVHINATGKVSPIISMSVPRQ